MYHRKTAPKINYKPNNVIYRHTPYIVRSYFPLSLILIPRLIVLLGVVGPITDDNWILLPERSRDTWHHPRDINCELNYCRLIKLIPGNIDYQTWALVRCVAISLINNMLLLLWKYIQSWLDFRCFFIFAQGDELLTTKCWERYLWISQSVVGYTRIVYLVLHCLTNVTVTLLLKCKFCPYNYVLDK